MPSYAVIGASRGIGLEYVRQLASRSDAVVLAIVRNPEGSTHLNALAAGFKNIHIISGDVAEHSTLERAAQQVAEVTGGKLDYLIHNAANLNPDTVFKGFEDYTNMDKLDHEFISAFKVNSLGPIHSIMAFLPLLRASNTKKIVVIGSGAGDVKAVRAFGMGNMVAYGMTKAAALIATTKFAIELKDEGFVVVSLTPGVVDTSATAGADVDAVHQGIAAFASSVKTNIGVEISTQTPEASVAAQLRVIDALQPAQNGTLTKVEPLIGVQELAQPEARRATSPTTDTDQLPAAPVASERPPDSWLENADSLPPSAPAPTPVADRLFGPELQVPPERMVRYVPGSHSSSVPKSVVKQLRDEIHDRLIDHVIVTSR